MTARAPFPEGHKVMKFNVLQASVRAYQRNLNTHSSYKDFRKARAKLRDKGKELDSMILAQFLDEYAETGNQYVEVLQKIIKQADEAGLAKGPKELQKLYKQITSAKGNAEGITDIKLFDQIASADALGKTKDLLYDVTTKSKLGNATR